MNATLVGWCVGMSMIYGFLPWLVIQLTMMSIASLFGLWLFYVQHQFEDTYWAGSDEWITPPLPWRGAATTTFQGCSNGSLATSDTITFTTSTRKSPITTWSDVTTTSLFPAGPRTSIL